MRDIEYVVYKKDSKGNWKVVRVEMREEEIYKQLARDLIAKKINECTYIRLIKRKQNYDGTITITIYYDNDVKRTYTIAEV